MPSGREPAKFRFATTTARTVRTPYFSAGYLAFHKGFTFHLLGYRLADNGDVVAFKMGPHPEQNRLEPNVVS